MTPESFKFLDDQRELIKALTEQRDELLSVLESVLKCGRGTSERIIIDADDEIEIIEAIKKAKGQ